MELSWFDSHCHLADSAYFPDFQSQAAHAEKSHVTLFVLAGSWVDDWGHQDALYEQFPALIRKVCGIHPWQVGRRSPSEIAAALKGLAEKAPELHAIGEIGLDFSKNQRAPLQLQMEIFEKQLDMAVTFKRPVVLHAVKAHSEMVTALKKRHGLTGFVHGFNGNRQMARDYLNLGFHLSVGPQILQQSELALLEFIPMERIFFESDGPRLAPPWALKLFDPQDFVKIKEQCYFSSAMISKIALYYCEKTAIPLQQLHHQVWSNFTDLFQSS